MSWNQFECSTNDGRSVALYEFSYGAKSFLYTNADRDIEIDNRHWTAIAISDKGLSAGSGNNLEVTMPSDSDVAVLYRTLVLSNAIKIKIHRYHESDELKEFQTVWVGSVQEIKREAIERIKVITTSVASAFSRSGLRLTYGRACPYSLYDHNCTLIADDYAYQTTIVSVTGSSIIVEHIKETESYFSGGFLSFDFDGIKELRGLKEQKGTEIHIIGTTFGLTEGQDIILYAGCDHTVNTCKQKFNNLLNYGGQPHIPTVSPYEVTKLF